jgi:hypothetical protein
MKTKKTTAKENCFLKNTPLVKLKLTILTDKNSQRGGKVQEKENVEKLDNKLVKYQPKAQVLLYHNEGNEKINLFERCLNDEKIENKIGWRKKYEKKSRENVLRLVFYRRNFTGHIVCYGCASNT